MIESGILVENSECFEDNSSYSFINNIKGVVQTDFPKKNDESQTIKESIKRPNKMLLKKLSCNKAKFNDMFKYSDIDLRLNSLNNKRLSLNYFNIDSKNSLSDVNKTFIEKSKVQLETMQIKSAVQHSQYPRKLTPSISPINYNKNRFKHKNENAYSPCENKTPEYANKSSILRKKDKNLDFNVEKELNNSPRPIKNLFAFGTHQIESPNINYLKLNNSVFENDDQIFKSPINNKKDDDGPNLKNKCQNQLNSIIQLQDTKKSDIAILSKLANVKNRGTNRLTSYKNYLSTSNEFDEKKVTFKDSYNSFVDDQKFKKNEETQNIDKFLKDEFLINSFVNSRCPLRSEKIHKLSKQRDVKTINDGMNKVISDFNNMPYKSKNK